MSNKEPWLAVNLSKIFPGLGQIYSNKRVKGYLIIFSNLALNLIGFWLIFSPEGNIVTAYNFLGIIILLWFWNLFDAYGSAKSNNNQEFEALRKQTKDPWLAMFFSEIVLGIGFLGFLGMGKWYLALLVLLFFSITVKFLPINIRVNLPLFLPFILASLVLSFLNIIVDFLPISIRVNLLLFLPFLFAFVAYLSYILTPVRRERSSKRAIIIALLIAISDLLYTPIIPLPTIIYGSLVKKFVVETRWIPSGSMEPTLHGTTDQWKADKILVDKLSYRFQDPLRGDIVVFSPTQELEKEQYQDAMVKRIVGLPGEKVELRDGKVYINNKPLEEQYLAPKQRTVLDTCTSGVQPPFLSRPQTIPPDSYLVLGDNRNNAYDSRCWGVVPRNLIIGKAYKRVFPLDRVGSL